jgi:hypothetical protein
MDPGLEISPIINQSITLLPGRLMVKALPLSQTFKVRTRYTSNPSCKVAGWNNTCLKAGFNVKPHDFSWGFLLPIHYLNKSG